MSSGVEADIALDAAVVLTLGLNTVLGHTAGLGATAAESLAAFAAARAAARQDALDELERYDRAVRRVIHSNARIMALAESQRAAAERFGVPTAALPEPFTVGTESPDELAAWCERTDAEIVEAERSLSRRVAAAVAGRLFTAPTAGLTTAVDAREPSHDHATERPHDEATRPSDEVAETLIRVLGRLLPDTADGDYRSVTEAAKQVVLAATPGAAEGLLTEVRLRVLRANESTERRRAELAGRAAEREALEREEAERRYVLDAVTTAFTEMGYEVETGFETLTARDGEVVLTRDEWPQHAVTMRLDDASQISAEMVRAEPPRSDDDRRLDTEREEQWCAAFEQARVRLAAAGVRSDVRWRLEPGRQELPVTQAPRRARRAAPKAQARERHHEPE